MKTVVLEKMATDKENNVGNRFIEDSGVIGQNLGILETTPPSSSLQDTQPVNHPTVLAVPLFPNPSLTSHTSSSSSNSLAVTYMQASSKDAQRVASMSSGPGKPTQGSLYKSGTSSGHTDEVHLKKVVKDSLKVDPAFSKSLPESCQKSTVSESKVVTPLPYNIVELPGNKEVPALHQNKNVIKDQKLVPAFHQPHLSPPLTNASTVDEPLNLTLGQKSSEKVIASSLFGVITKQNANGKASDVLSAGRASCVSSSSSDYKVEHPIGSRKVTENIITYHEPMFQSVANTLFENQKNLLMGKRKAEEEKSKGDSSFQDSKRCKLESTSSPNKVLDGKTIVKKKCTIENIIERIRTEKTLSRGGNAQVPKPTEHEKEKTNAVNVKNLQSEIVTNEGAKEQSDSANSKGFEKDDSVVNTLKLDVHEERRGKEASVHEEIKQSNDIKIEMQETDSITNDKRKIKTDITNVQSESKNCDSSPQKLEKSESNKLKEKKSEANLSKQKSDLSLAKQKKGEGKPVKQKKLECTSPKSLNSDSGTPKQKKVKSCSPKQKKDNEGYSPKQKKDSEGNSPKQKKDNESNSPKQKKDREGNSPKQKKDSEGNSPKQKKDSDGNSPKQKKDNEGNSPKQKKDGEGNCKKVKDFMSNSTKDSTTENGEKKENIKNDKSRLDIKGKKFTKMKELNYENSIKKNDDVPDDSDIDLNKTDDLIIKKTIGEKVKVKRNIQNALDKSSKEPKKVGRKKKIESESKKMVERKKTSAVTKIEGKKQSAIKKKSEIKTKITKQRKQKLPIACRRVKREASLNAAIFLNILNEKSPRVSKLASQRSKSDSDVKHVQVVSLHSSHSMNDVGFVETGTNSNSFKKGFKSPKKEKISPLKNFGDTPKLGKQISQEDVITPKIEPKSPKKTPSPKRKVSFSDSVYDYEDVFDAVIQKSIDATEKFQPPEKKRRGRKAFKGTKFNDIKKKKVKDVKQKTEKNIVKLKKEKKKKKFRLQKIKQAIKMTVSKSPEEVAERKRKANLARLERAKELMKTERKVSEKNSVVEKDSDDSVSVTSEKEDGKLVDETEPESKTDDNKKVRAKKGALCRAARTHVSVESKTVVENTMPSPRWCECCQSSYYPYQPTQGTQVWRIKHLVDKDSAKSPEPIQSSSNHFIAAHARCEVRPYASPSHVSVIDSTPYVGQIVPHGHIQCSACSCGHSGVFHPGQCQNCTLGGVSNMLPCQRYGSTYSVTYPHTHGSYTHCGCGACYPAGSYHHSVGQTLIHQPQMSMSAESSILLHHPVQLQVTHETTHPVSMPAITHSHNDSSLTHSVQPVPLQLSHSEQNLSSLTHMCQLSQGEVTNVSVMASSSPCDHEIDVGSRDDIVKSVPNVSQMSYTIKHVDKDSKIVKTKKIHLKEPVVKLKRSKSCDSQVKSSVKVKETKKLKDTVKEKKEDKMKLKEKKRSSLLLIKQKQKQLEQKSLKLSQKKVLKSSVELTEDSFSSKKVKVKSGDLKVRKKVKRSVSSEQKKEEKAEKENAKRAWHGWSWEGKGVVKKIINIFDGQTVERKCFNAIRHDDGDTIQVKDCVLVRSGQKEKDIPYVAKVSNFWEDSLNGEMMMSVLWFYRPEHAEGGPIFGSLENEVFAAKHRDETLVACIEDKGYVLTYNEYCRFMAEVERTKSDLPPRKKVVPESEETYPSNRIPPVDINPENVFLCRQGCNSFVKEVIQAVTKPCEKVGSCLRTLGSSTGLSQERWLDELPA